MQHLVVELTTRSPLFRRQWAEHRVSAGLRNNKVLYHPSAGSVEVFNELLTLHAAPGQTLFLLIPHDTERFEKAFHTFLEEA